MSRDQLATAIVVPCYNERARLRPDEFLDFLRGYPQVHFLMVDDGSRDGTWTMLERMRASEPERISTRRLERNGGKAEAVRRGISKALEDVAPQGTPLDLVGYWDADLSTPLAALPLFTEVFVERPACHLVVGSRVRLMGRRIVRRPMRHYLGRVFSTLASLSLALPATTPSAGQRSSVPVVSLGTASPVPSLTPGSSTWKSCRACVLFGVPRRRAASWSAHSRSGRTWLDPSSGSGTVRGRR